MRIPRDLSGPDLIRALAMLGYAVTRQTSAALTLGRARRRALLVDRGRRWISI
jgi:hypothetical protein